MKAISRRAFLRFVSRLTAVAGLGAVIGPIVAYFYPPSLEAVPAGPVPVGAVDRLPVGAARVVRYGRYPALVLNTTAGLRAYSAVCTHFACIVKWDAARGLLVCPCHEGFFDPEDGGVISGPPPSALNALPVYVADGQIYVGGTA